MFPFKAYCLGCRASSHFRCIFYIFQRHRQVIWLSEYLNKMSAYFIFKAYALRSTVASIHPAILDAFSIFRSTAGGGKYLKSNSVDWWIRTSLKRACYTWKTLQILGNTFCTSATLLLCSCRTRAHKPNDASIRTSKKALMPLKPSKFQGPLEKPHKFRLQLSSKYL